MDIRKTIVTVMSFLVVLGIMGASETIADVPTYSLQTILDSPSCTSVDLSPDRARLYARIGYGPWDEGYRVFDANTLAPLWDYRPGENVNSAPWRGLVSSDCNYLYMTTYYGGAVKKIQVDPNTGIEAASISVGSWAYGMAFDSQRRFLYAEQGCPGTGVQGSIQVINTTSDSIDGNVPLNGEPSGIIVAPGDQYFYVNSRTRTAHTLYKVQISDLQPAGTFSLSASDLSEHAFSLSPDGNTAYLPDPDGNSVHVLRTSDMVQTGLWSISGVAGFFVSPDGSHALVTGLGSPTLRVFDLSSETVVQTLDIGTILSAYWPVCWDWDGGLRRVYLPAADAGVAVLTPEPATLSLLGLGGLAVVRRRRKK